ncbi:proline-rich protein 3-like [Lotus japonicus]|uniref:proline-rich protein 3-like n=1 Tax=Lotus japonicus TaxID=34305 RepID=UPI00258E7AFA|nr:proline-rich protein 3-like [Lotus japonicus]
MAFLQSTFATSIFLFALLAIASATDYYGDGQTQKLEKPKPETDYKPQPTKPDYEVPKRKGEGEKPHLPAAPKLEKPKPETYYKLPHPTKPDYVIPKPKGEVEKPQLPAPKLEKPKPETYYKLPHPAKPDYEIPKPKGEGEKPQLPAPKLEKPKFKTGYKAYPTKPDYEAPKPKGESEKQFLPTVIGVQGIVLCKSGSNYFPIQGAVVRVTCGCVSELGYESGPISVWSHVTDSKGYFLAKLSLAELGSELKFTECKAYLESSPLENCKVPTDVNYGISGARLSSYRLIDNKTKLYSVKPFFYTSQPKVPVPSGY